MTWFVFGAASAVVLVLLLSKTPTQTERESGVPARVEEGTGVAPVGDSPQAPLDVQEQGNSRAQPDKQEKHLLTGSVRSDDGSPISGARLRWLALRFEDVEENPVWRSVDWGRSERDTLETLSRADGTFEFDAAPGADLSYGTILLALHQEHAGMAVDIQVPTTERAPLELMLMRCPPIAVQVVDAKGRGLGGALVRHEACIEQPVTEADFGRAHARRFLADEIIADQAGRAKLSRFSGRQVLFATKGVDASLPWQGTDPVEVELIIGTSFTVEGSLSVPPWDPTYHGERRILVSGLRGTLWHQIACLRDVQAGGWGPLNVPATGLTRFRVRLEGSPIIPQEVEFAPLAPGQVRRIEFAAEVGANLWFDVEDSAGARIPTARAEVWWSAPDQPAGIGHVEFGAGPAGHINTWSFPPGIVNYRISAPGYASEDNYIEVPHDGGFLVTLAKGGAITGRCTSAGAPVPNFEVFCRREGMSGQLRSQVFLDCQDGSYEIDGIAAGSWLVSGASPESPSSAYVVASVEVGREAVADLELPVPVRGVGRVVDAVTNEPLPNARIQIHSGGLERTKPWGQPIGVAQDGSFDLDAFVPGRNFVTALAEGYAAREIEKALGSEDLLDWGDIPLFSAQDLRLRVIGGPPPGCTLTQLIAVGQASQPLPETRFDASGEVVFERVSPGRCVVGIIEPSKEWSRIDVELIPGADWSYDFQLTGARSLDVIVKGPGGEPLAYSPQVLITAQEETGLFVVRDRLAQDGLASCAGIRAERVDISVIDEQQQVAAKSEAHFRTGSHQRVEIHLGEKPLRIHVVDADGGALPAAWVTARSQALGGIQGVDDTDSEGWASLFGLPAETILLDVQHGLAGKRMGVPVNASEEEIEIVLEAKGSLDLRLRDGAEPLANVLTWIETAEGLALSDQKATDASGQVLYGPLGEGNYRFAFRRSDCWPQVLDVGLGPDEKAARDVQMRRLVDLELTVLNAQGIVVSGVPIELTSTEFATPVQSWIAEERVRSRTGLTTDALGRVSVAGLPHGTYAWSVAVQGQAVTGSFELIVGAPSPVLIRLP